MPDSAMQKFFNQPGRDQWKALPELMKMRWEYEQHFSKLQGQIDDCDCGKFSILFAGCMTKLDKMNKETKKVGMEKTEAHYQQRVVSEMDKLFDIVSKSSDKDLKKNLEANTERLKTETERHLYYIDEIVNDLNALQDTLLGMPMEFNRRCSCSKR